MLHACGIFGHSSAPWSVELQKQHLFLYPVHRKEHALHTAQLLTCSFSTRKSCLTKNRCTSCMYPELDQDIIPGWNFYICRLIENTPVSTCVRSFHKQMMTLKDHCMLNYRTAMHCLARTLFAMRDTGCCPLLGYETSLLDQDFSGCYSPHYENTCVLYWVLCTAE